VTFPAPSTFGVRVPCPWCGRRVGVLRSGPYQKFRTHNHPGGFECSGSRCLTSDELVSSADTLIDLTGEIWCVSPGFPDYEVSNAGRVRDRFGVKVKQSSGAYSRVTLRRGDESFGLKVPGLVMEAFVGPRPKGFETDHVNGNKADNRLCNLEYVTKKENLRRKSLRLKATGYGPVAFNTASPEEIWLEFGANLLEPYWLDRSVA
jgi:hypothetical protein